MYRLQSGWTGFGSQRLVALAFICLLVSGFPVDGVAHNLDTRANIQLSSDRRDDQSQLVNDNGLRGSYTNCTLVELYPGYPGYRGNITGVMVAWGGTGDYMCQEDLEARNPSFSKNVEDRANRRAAKALGISGVFEDWTWENWMMIELQRGMIAQCYSCLMTNPNAAPINPDIQPDATDSRLRIGMLGSREAIDRLVFAETGQRAPANFVYEDDYVLRASAYVMLGASANAPELLQGMEQMIAGLYVPGGGFYSPAQIMDLIANYGGYTPVAFGGAPDDQILVGVATLWVMSPGMPDMMMANYARQFQEIIDNWKMTGYQGSLADKAAEYWGL